MGRKATARPRGERASRAARLVWAMCAATVVALLTVPAAFAALSHVVHTAMTSPPSAATGTAAHRDGALPPDPADRAISPADGELGTTQLVPTSAETTGASAAPSGVYALIVGINDYPGSGRDLRSAVADADVMVDALNRFNVPPSNILELVDGQATSAAIAQGIDWLVDVAGPDSTAVFFYSGHARKLAAATEAIIGSDGVAITDQSLANLFAPLRARDAWLVIAACYGGGFDELVRPGRILTAAADTNNLAWENDSFGQSYLGEYLVRRALFEGRAGGATVQQAFTWAQASILNDAPSRTLTQIDASTAPVSLDGIARTTVPPTAVIPSATPPTSPPPSRPPPSPSPPPRPPTPTPTTVRPPCKNLLGLGCSSQSN